MSARRVREFQTLRHRQTLLRPSARRFEDDIQSKESNLMRVEPLGDKVVVKRLEAEETTSGGIILPDSAKEKPQQGRVLSVGDGRLLADGSRAPTQIQEGDRILFTGYAGTEILVEDDELLIMSEDEILDILD